jgi:hypothetical protein
MPTKIICDTCGEVLRNGSPGSKMETRTCIPCVQNNAPLADPKAIKKPPSMSDSLANMSHQANFKKRQKQASVPVEVESSLLVQDKKVLFALNFTLGGTQKFDIAFTKEQLQEFLVDIERVEIEEQINK